jgi:hypothetical protein
MDMSENGFRFLLDNIGRPHPCGVCGRPSTRLREVLLPGAAIFNGQVVVHTVVWICPECPG